MGPPSAALPGSDRPAMLAVSDDLKTPITSLCLHARFVEDADTRVRMPAAVGEMQRMTDDSLAFIREDMRSEETRTVDLHLLLESIYDVAMSLPGLLDEIENRQPGVDAVVIACFDDTGLDAARAACDVPVVGIGEAAFHAASFLCCRFSVVTTLGRSVPGIEANLQRYGLASRCARVRASEVPVLDLERGDPAVVEQVADQIAAAMLEVGAEAIVLGCAGMTELAASLARRFGIPVIDGVASAVTFAEALVAAGYKTSKIGGYAHPVR